MGSAKGGGEVSRRGKSTLALSLNVKMTEVEYRGRTFGELGTCLYRGKCEVNHRQVNNTTDKVSLIMITEHMLQP